MNISEEAKLLKQRHVLLLQRGDEGYGVASTVCEFALALVQHQQSVSLVCVTEGRLSAKLRDAGFEVDVLGLKPPPRDLNGSLVQRARLKMQATAAEKDIARQVISRYQQSSVDVVQSMNFLLLESCGRIATALQATGVWRMPSGVQTARFRKLKQYMMSRVCDKHGLISMANSDFTRQSIARHSPLSVYVHHGCDPVRFNPDTVNAIGREAFGIGPADIVFGVFAHIPTNGEKGQHLAVKALRAHLDGWADKRTHVHLILFGDPIDSDYANSLRTCAASCERLTLHLPGAVPDVERYYPLIDVSLSTITGPEAFGLSVIESMMMGVPVLAHKLGGPGETIINNKTGWLVQQPEVPHWQAAFAHIIDQRRTWPEYSANARAHALDRFTIDVEVRGWADVLDTLG